MHAGEHDQRVGGALAAAEQHVRASAPALQRLGAGHAPRGASEPPGPFLLRGRIERGELGLRRGARLLAFAELLQQQRAMQLPLAGGLGQLAAGHLQGDVQAACVQAELDDPAGGFGRRVVEQQLQDALGPPAVGPRAGDHGQQLQTHDRPVALPEQGREQVQRLAGIAAELERGDDPAIEPGRVLVLAHQGHQVGVGLADLTTRRLGDHRGRLQLHIVRPALQAPGDGAQGPLRIMAGEQPGCIPGDAARARLSLEFGN